MMLFQPPEVEEEELEKGDKVIEPFSSFNIVRESKRKVYRSIGLAIFFVLLLVIGFYVMAMAHTFGRGGLFCRL